MKFGIMNNNMEKYHLQNLLFLILCSCLIGCSEKIEYIDMDKIKFKIEVVNKQTPIGNINAKEANIDKEILMEDEMFIKKIIHNNSRDGFYVSVDIESQEYNGKVVVDIGNLYWYFYKTRDLNREESKGIMYWVLKEKLTLKIAKCNFNCIQSYFSIIHDDTAIISNAQKGIDHFIETYFNGRYIKKDIALGSRNAIINQLYNFNIASQNDCESGYLKIVDTENSILKTGRKPW
ncbi:MAG: hypothetical protein LBB56_06915 [Chitinispirillales bacterium]|nr:hypothetical protein [Chitinispirillales bacterium]